MKKHIKIISGLFFLAFLISCSSKEMKKAKEFMEAAMYEQAISLLEIEIQDKPKNAEASFLLGKCYIETSNQNKVEEYFKRAILLDTDFKEDIGNVYFDKSLKLFKEDNIRLANAYYDEGFKYNPVYKETFANQLYDFVSEFSETTTEIEKPIQLFSTIDNITPNFKTKIAEKTFSLAKSFIDKGFVIEGFKYADFGIKYDTKHIKDVADLYFNYAKDLMTVQNKPNECFSYFDRCIELNPEKKIEVGNTIYSQAKVYETKNEIGLLLIFAKKSSEIIPDYKLWYKEIEEKNKPKIPINGLIAYYPFNGNANNESSNSYHGRIVGATFSINRFGEANSAIYFDGNDYVNFGPDPISPLSDLTFCVWFRTLVPYGYIISTGGGTMVSTGYYMSIEPSYQISAGHANSNYSTLEKVYQVEPNKWYCYTGVFNRISGEFSHYINGEFIKKSKPSSGRIAQQYRDFVIGRPNSTNRYSFKGWIDDLRIYNRVLTNDEINEVYREMKN